MRFATILNLLPLVALASADLFSATLETDSLEARDLHARTDKGFSCPKGMSYCPWTRACSCQPGMSYDKGKSACTGAAIKGAWPKPSLKAYASVGVELGTYCAASPTKIVKYDAKHKYCKASLENVAFCAPKTIEKDLASVGAGVEINLGASIGADLKHVCAGLSGLYLGSVTDAVALFNTNRFGLGLSAGLGVGFGSNIFSSIKTLPCLVGLSRCNQDCVSYCTKGCGNYLDVGGSIGGSVGGSIGGSISGLVGFCALPDVLLTISAAGQLVSTTIDGLLCVVGGVLTTILKTFDCNCGN
ncbi:hypothetical protein B0I35DRAFT_418145 [Stachybotrys elegans]|uniref:Uncharacterized protein n=1 Tax=Stachybotrys elegans TaxID=80388 RepID=A0A8K0T217_9HYPO|nr:hypothetical protein B0I35DRAFT_418145 [Stachybotrys elegans]